MYLFKLKKYWLVYWNTSEFSPRARIIISFCLKPDHISLDNLQAQPFWSHLFLGSNLILEKAIDSKYSQSSYFGSKFHWLEQIMMDDLRSARLVILFLISWKYSQGVTNICRRISAQTSKYSQSSHMFQIRSFSVTRKYNQVHINLSWDFFYRRVDFNWILVTISRSFTMIKYIQVATILHNLTIDFFLL